MELVVSEPVTKIENFGAVGLRATVREPDPGPLMVMFLE
jgi:hypothetical protein